MNRHCTAFIVATFYLCALVWIGGVFGTAWAAALFIMAVLAAAKLTADEWKDG